MHRRWIILATLFINLAMIYGAWYAYSVFLVALLREFHWSRSVVAGGFSVFLLVHGSLSPVTGYVAGRTGPRRLILVGSCTLGCGLLLAAETSQWWHLYLAFGAISAVGISMAGWVTSVLCVRGWFPSQMGKAVGIASAGIGVGISLLVPLTQYLIDWAGWRWAFRILAILIVGWVLPATYWLVRDPDSLEAPTTARRARLGSAVPTGGHWVFPMAVRDRRYWALAGVFFAGNVVTQMLLVHQVAYLVEHGVSPLAAAGVGGVVGLASIAGKLTWGTLSDRSGREPAYTLAFACVVASIVTLVLAGGHPASVLPYAYGVLIGLGYAGTAPLTPAAASDLFAGPGFSTIFGSLHMLQCLGAAIGSWGAGRIYDWTGSYAGALWMALASALLAPALMWMAAPRHPHPPPEPRLDGGAPRPIAASHER
jgi:MFS family permease